MGRDWKRYRQSAEERRASALAAVNARWRKYHESLDTASEPASPEPADPLLVITLTGRLCGRKAHRLELFTGSRCGRYRRDMSLTQLLEALRRRFHVRSLPTGRL